MPGRGTKALFIIFLSRSVGQQQGDDGLMQVPVDPMGGAYSPSEAIFQASTWAPLDAAARARQYVASAAVGLLGPDQRACARLIDSAEFRYGDAVIRGASALSELPHPVSHLHQRAPNLPASTICVIGKGAILTLETVQRMLVHSLGETDGDPKLAQELASLPELIATPADERALLAIIFIREASRQSSPLMPYLQALLWNAHEHIPSAWNPSSPDGAKRRAQLVQTEPSGPKLLQAADALRKSILTSYADVLPKALEQLPRLLVHGVAETQQGVASFYSFQKFAETWLGMRSRSFSNEAYGMLVPLICLMNHPAPGEDGNVEAEYDASKGFIMSAKHGSISAGSELKYKYGSNLCRERALLVYGFAIEGMPTCEGFGS